MLTFEIKLVSLIRSIFDICPIYVRLVRIIIRSVLTWTLTDPTSGLNSRPQSRSNRVFRPIPAKITQSESSLVHVLYLGLCKLENEIFKEAKNVKKAQF